MVYMHIILFIICLNFGMGLAHIPGTPLSIGDAYEVTNMNCYNDFSENGMLTYIPDTADVNGVIVTSGIHQNIVNLAASVNATGYNPITEAIEDSYQAGVTLKNFLLGGYITSIMDHITLNCDFDPESPTYGKAIDTEVMQYFKGGINVIFMLLIALAVFYLITGRSFGL
jgi:hypothetical protein